MGAGTSSDLDRKWVVSLETCLRRLEDFKSSGREEWELEVDVDVVDVVNTYGVEGTGEYKALMLENRTCFMSAGIGER